MTDKKLNHEKNWNFADIDVVVNGKVITPIKPAVYETDDSEFPRMEFYLRRGISHYFRDPFGLRMKLDVVDRLPLKYGDTFGINITRTMQ